MKRLAAWICAVVCLSTMVCVLPVTAVAQDSRHQEAGLETPWYMSARLGRIDFEGDQSFDDGVILSVGLGYDLNEAWSWEGSLHIAPSLDSHALEGRQAPDWSSTHALGVSLDGLFHFTRWDRLDPYLAVGVGLSHFGEDPLDGEQDEVLLRGGGGVMYHFNDEWAIRADFRGMLAGFGNSPNANSIADVGVNWTWGARVKPQIVAVGGGVLDSDGDGLSDAEENALGTDPYDPDSDKDELSDGDEVQKYRTDPMNPDTDWDSLKDGQEVLAHRTDPLARDTDNGGVSDGHEVIEDQTNPLLASDDLMLFELYINFDRDQSTIKPEFFSKLDVVGKVMARHPDSTARIEGHADKNRKSGADHNMKLSERRARSVLDYLAGPGGIARTRMQAVGYGFTRPKAPNGDDGNPQNRRVEVYLRGADLATDGGAVRKVLPAPMPVKDTEMAPEDK